MSIDQFRDAIRDAGMEPPEVIEPGRIQRFPGAGKRKRNGNTAAWCKLFNDGLGGCFGDWSSGFSGNWQAKRDKPLTATEREAFHRHVAEAQAQAEVEERSRNEAAAVRAAQILAVATGDPDTHPYASRKRVSFGPLVKRGAWPQRGWPDALLVPIYGADGRVWSVEAVNADGAEDFLKDGRTGGGFHALGEVSGAERVLIAEGLANAAVGRAVEGSPAVAALSSSNLKATARAVRRLAPAADIVVIADFDPEPDGTNPGVKAAEEAAAACGGRVAIPEIEARKCDFWDLWHERGVEAVREAVASAKAPDTENTPEDLAAAVLRLAKLSPLQYDQVRGDEAEALGVRVSTLDTEVEKLRRKMAGDSDDVQGEAVLFPDIEPWHEPVNGGAAH